MRVKGRSLLVIALLLFGGYAVYDYMKEKKAETTQAESAKLLSINFDQVDSIEIDRGSEKIQIKRTVEGWNVESPIKDLGDNNAADDLVKMASSEKILDVAKEGPGIDWSLYGLDQPAGSITFINSAGQKNSFQISNKLNFENNPFARRDNEDRVLVVNSSWQTRVKKTVTEFRDRRFLRAKMASIEDFNLKNQAGRVQISLKDGRWIAPANKDLILDQQKVRELFRGISNAKGASFVEGKMPALKSLFVLDLKLGDKAWKGEVGQAPSKKIYAKVSDPSLQMEMEPGALDNLISLKIEDLKEGATPKENKKPGDDETAQIAEKKDKL
ncbi:MAG: DUF4340 domain-containing protein [Bdellovibrio sp.]|nr:DUF4340 domain-containing protein [Bdellovibrio sp.]